MKFFFIISFILFGGFIEIVSQLQDVHNCSKLVELSDEINNEQDPEKLKLLEEEFFSFFPKNFKEFVSCYGYTENRSYDYTNLSEPFLFSPLYEYSKAHIDVFYNLNSISNKRLIRRIVDVSMNGHWQGDAVNIFKYGYRTILKNNLKEFLIYLASFEYNEVESFWYFYFDGPCPEDDIPGYLKPIKNSYPDIYEAMLSAASKVKLEWEDY